MSSVGWRLGEEGDGGRINVGDLPRILVVPFRDVGMVLMQCPIHYLGYAVLSTTDDEMTYETSEMEPNQTAIAHFVEIE